MKFGLKSKQVLKIKPIDALYGDTSFNKDSIRKLLEEIIKSNIQEGDSITMDIGKNETELKIKITSAKTSEEK